MFRNSQKNFVTAKLRFMLETLEKVGRPDYIDEGEWLYRTARSVKWETFRRLGDKNHPWVRNFLKCVNKCCVPGNEQQESEDIIRIFFNIVDSGIHLYFNSAKINENMFKSPRILCTVECLEKLEQEILNYFEKIVLGNLDTSHPSSSSQPPMKQSKLN